MELFLTLTLLVSVVAMAAILWLKRYELSTGQVFFAGLRPRLAAALARGFGWAEYVLPGLLSAHARRLFAVVRRGAHAATAWAVIAAESLLERGLEFLRRATAHTPARHGEASPFLREVAEHKKKLLENREE